ncbi:MAG: hypothetical protein KJ749_11750 [Planctomycetes bacterium]|nr:hypothetical protein [Planctomycetota bacterium]
MRSRFRRTAMIAGLIVAGGFLMVNPGMSCLSYSGESLLGATNFCFIFDCQSGILGGTIDPCSGANPLFADCDTVAP